MTWEYTGYKVTDYLPQGIAFYSFDESGLSSTTSYSYSFKTWTTSNWDIVEWNFTFKDWFKNSDTLTIKFKAKVVELYKKYSTNLACLLPPGETEICDKKSVEPRIVLNIKKYVSDSINWPWYDTGMVLVNGKNAYFKIVVDGADYPLEKFIVKDALNDSKLLFKNESRSLASNAFTWTIKFGTVNTWVKDDYKITPNVHPESWETQLSWDVFMWKWLFMSWDKFEAIFMAEKKADVVNLGCVDYEKLEWEKVEKCDPAEVYSQTWNILTIKKYVSKDSNFKNDGSYSDANTTNDAIILDTTPNQRNIFFKLVVKDAKISFTWFKVKDSLDNSMYTLLTGDTLKLSDNAFTGIMVKWSKNTVPFTYVITPKITQNGNNTDLEWDVKMTSWSVFMEGDTLTIYFKAEKKRNDNDKNTACVYDKTGNTSYACDPAYVKRGCLTNCSSWGGWGWWGWGWWGSNCRDGYKNGIEYCDWWGVETRIPEDGKLFKNSDTRDTRYAWWTCTSSCTLRNEKTEESPKCFNVQNGSISIMKWEMLPFFWNMQAILWKPGENSNYLKDNFVANCSASNGDGHINLSTMMCNFVIRGPRDSWVDEVYKVSLKCIDFNGWWKDSYYYPPIKDFIAQNKDWWFWWSELYKTQNIHNVFDSLDNWDKYPILYPVSSKVLIKNFGMTNPAIVNSSAKVEINRNYRWLNSDWSIKYFWEYKVSLDSVDFDVCDWEWKSTTYHAGGVDTPVCEVDFAVTNKYLVQKSPYWAISSSTPLQNYKRKNWTVLFPWNDETKAVDYSVPWGLKTSLETFIKKYMKSAVSLGVKNNCWGLTLEKVQWKSIYFLVNNDTSSKRIDLKSCISDTQKPYTLITVKGKNNAWNIDITIKWNLYTNAMIMTEGQIIFDAWGYGSPSNPTACNGDMWTYTSKWYWHAGQMVKWIFYAGAGFLSENDVYNKEWSLNVDNAEWCNYWNLHIKWVVIGNLQNVLENRRSELYTWFKENSRQATDGWKNVALNWASVLVEYSPDLWWNLPPGAEEFNKALEVYRK